MSELFPRREPQPELDAVARSERFIEALAKRAPVDGDTGDRALAALLENWRDELRAPAPGTVCPEQDAVAALSRGLVVRRHARRRTVLTSVMAAAVLSVAGFGVLLGQAQPGEPLYGARTALFGEPASVNDEQIAVSAESELNQVEQLIALGQWDQAHDKLAAVGAHVQTVRNADRKQGLLDHMNLLNAKVVSRDPHATALPGGPSITLRPNRLGG